MRLISQNKNYDIPYEDCIIQLNCRCHDIICLINGHEFLMGVYSSQEQAQAVMSDLVKAYCVGDRSFVFPPSGRGRKVDDVFVKLYGEKWRTTGGANEKL